MSNTLVLAPDYQPVNFLPLSTIHWTAAVKLYFLEKVNVLEWYDDWTIHSATIEMQVPAVVVTKKGFKREKHGKMRFTRHNMFLRDLFSCQYCGEAYSGRNLTIDHVVPLSKGGKTNWENCVTACKSCNSAKSDRLVQPKVKPVCPDYWKLVNGVKNTSVVVQHSSWPQYIGVKTTTLINQRA